MVAGFGFAPIRDDKDFDEIDDGYRCGDHDRAAMRTGNTMLPSSRATMLATAHSTIPDGNDDTEAELAQITVDTKDPVFVEAQHGPDVGLHGQRVRRQPEHSYR